MSLYLALNRTCSTRITNIPIKLAIVRYGPGTNPALLSAKPLPIDLK